MKLILGLTFAFTATALVSACSSIPVPSTPLNITKTITLPKALSETSGLSCADDNQILSINDSGNAPVVYSVSYDGTITEELALSIRNNDWEAITADEDYLFVADIGNNKGQREQLEVYKVSRQDINNVTPLVIKYADNNPAGNIPYAHDFDAEALVKKGGELLLFSKSWRSGNTHIYQINDQVNEEKLAQMLTPFASIEGLPGVVTGVDYDASKNQYVVVGYKSDPFGNFAAFMASLSSTFTVLNIWPLEGYKQVEGVCVDSEGAYWFSEEATDGRAASLSKALVL